MRARGSLKKRFEESLSSTPIAHAIEINDAGLVFGAGTVLARMVRGANDAAWLNLNADWQRVAALLAVAYGRTVPPEVFRHIKGASEQWRRGDKALANIRLAFARLPRLEDHASIYRLFHAGDLLERGVSPRTLMLAFGFESEVDDLAKYDPNQPRVPAGHGRESGEWGSGGNAPPLDVPSRSHPPVSPHSGDGGGKGPRAFLGPPATDTVVSDFLGDIAPEALEALAAFASRFSIPTAVLGALIIPSPNPGAIAQGTLPDHPDVSYRLDRPGGMLVLSAEAADGSDITIHAQNQNGFYVDISTGARVGRDLQGDLFLSWDAVEAAVTAREKPSIQVGSEADRKDDEPQLCPAPGKDTPHGASQRSINYEDDVHRRVNPAAPIPRGFAVRIMNWATGRPVYFDDCFRYAGDLVDRDMKKGDLVEAKGRGYAWLLLPEDERAEEVMQRLIRQATKQLQVADARGVGLKWYFAEKAAADIVRKRFAEEDELGRIVVAYMPPVPRRRRRK